MAGPIRIAILANASQAKREINSVGSSAEKGVSGAKKALLGLAGGLIGFAAVSKVTSVLKDSVAEAREAQKVGAQTAAVIKATGGAAKVTAGHVSDLAGAISRKAGIDDEVIQTSANMLLTFKDVRNEVGKGNAIFDQATQTVTDMSVALGQSGKSSAIQLGKALNDPIKGVAALGRVGVTFTDDQKKVIKSLTDSGDKLGAQKIILKELNSEFGGSAAAQATAGDKMKVAWGNVQEEIGTKLLPILDKVEIYVADHLPEWMAKGEAGVNKVKDAFAKVQPFIETVVGFLKKNPDTVKAFAIVLGVLAGAVALVSGAMAVLDAVLAVNPFTIVILAVAALAAGLVYAYTHSKTFKTIVDDAFTVVKDVIQGVWKVVSPIFKLWVLEVKALGAIAKWLWNNAFRPALSLILKVLGTLMAVWAKMLGALGHLPGFGWAKDAAKVMQDAADAARHISDELHKIPHTTSATVVLNVVRGVVYTTGGHVPLDPGSDPRTALLNQRGTSSSQRNYNINVTAPVGSDPYTIGESLVGYIREFEAAS